MADVVNLNQFRKAKARTDKSKQAQDNRSKFGRTKADKAKDEKARTKQSDVLDGKEITDHSDD